MTEIIVALDLPNAKQAEAMAVKLQKEVRWLKIGLELFIACGHDIMPRLKNMGFKIFLDLKFYDIPNTVAKAVESACRLRADMLTLHCQGGARMCEAAIDAASKYADEIPLLFGVTSLTSFADNEMPGINQSPGDYAVQLADLAAQWGLNGIVCSARELTKIKHNNPRLLCLCPGIRPKGNASDDQRRTTTPTEASRNGADFIVIGRPILRAEDPAFAARQIYNEISTI